MSIWTGLGISAVAIVGMWLLSDFQQKRRTKRTRSKLQAEWGRPRTPAVSDGIGVYHFHESNKSRDSLDDTTWADLNLDAVFRFLDRNESALGRERLYHRLRRTSGSPEDVRGFDATVDRLRANQSARQSVQMALALITEKDEATVWNLALDAPEPLPAWLAFWCPMFAIAMGAVLVLTILKPALIGFTVLAVMLAYWMRARIAWRLLPWMAPFRSVSQIEAAARRIKDSEPVAEPTTVVLKTRLPAIAGLARTAAWLGQDPSRLDIVSLIWEYLSFFFCIDGNVLLLAIRQVRRCQRELRDIAEVLGDLDAAISVASVRTGGAAWTRPTFVASSSTVEMSDLSHPLVSPCVTNSLTFGPSGVILTGANMTGKSTFLRSVGVNAVLAQSIGTVFASGYRAPWLTVRTCISPTDDLQAGKSLYQREAETVVSIVAQAANGPVTLCLFDELFRGTNSTDRIGASAAVFKYLAAGNPPCLVMAATHDLELVGVLGDRFCSYHFADRIAADRLEFDYCLRRGIAPSRNAVALLRLFGAPPALVADALQTVSGLPTVQACARS